MRQYIYTVKDKSGKTVAGKMAEKDVRRVADKLRGMGYTIINIKEERAGIFSSDIGERFGRVKLMDKVTFYIKLSSMLKAGIPLNSCLESIKEQITSKKFRRIISDIHRNILAGNSLSQSMSLYPNIFPELLVNIIQSGEASGKLVDVLEQYAVFSENQALLKQKIVSALIYPCILIVAAIGLSFIFLTYLLPKFVDLFRKSNIPLPLPTRILVNAGDFFSSNIACIIITIILINISLTLFIKFHIGRYIIDSIKLKIFYAGIIIRKVSIARFTRTLGTLYASGVPIIRALEICEKSTGNSVFSEAIRLIKERVIKGESFAGAMKENPIFPVDTVQMVAIGESSGNISFMLHKIADFYERDIDTALRRISSLIEPFIILVIGLVVGFLAYSVIIPIFDMMKAL